MKDSKENSTVVGYVKCSCCSMKVYLLNDAGLQGLPKDDYLKIHQRHIPHDADETHCPSRRIKYRSSRRQGEFFELDPPRPISCDHAPLINGRCICGANLVGVCK